MVVSTKYVNELTCILFTADLTSQSLAPNNTWTFVRILVRLYSGGIVDP